MTPFQYLLVTNLFSTASFITVQCCNTLLFGIVEFHFGVCFDMTKSNRKRELRTAVGGHRISKTTANRTCYLLSMKEV